MQQFLEELTVAHLAKFLQPVWNSKVHCCVITNAIRTSDLNIGACNNTREVKANPRHREISHGWITGIFFDVHHHMIREKEGNRHLYYRHSSVSKAMRPKTANNPRTWREHDSSSFRTKLNLNLVADQASWTFHWSGVQFLLS